MHHTRKARAENTLKAIAVMTAYYAEETGTALATQITTDYANEPDGMQRVIDGFVHFSARLLLTLEEAGLPRNEALQLMAEQVNADLHREDE